MGCPGFRCYTIGMALGSSTNLTDTNVARRLRFGIAMLAVGLLGAIFLQRLEISRAVRLALFVPFFLSTNSFFQGFYMTCGWSALSGVRHTAGGVERIASKNELRSVRARGFRQIGFAFLAAALLTMSFTFV